MHLLWSGWPGCQTSRCAFPTTPSGPDFTPRLTTSSATADFLPPISARPTCPMLPSPVVWNGISRSLPRIWAIFSKSFPLSSKPTGIVVSLYRLIQSSHCFSAPQLTVLGIPGKTGRWSSLTCGHTRFRSASLKRWSGNAVPTTAGVIWSSPPPVPARLWLPPSTLNASMSEKGGRPGSCLSRTARKFFSRPRRPFAMFCVIRTSGNYRSASMRPVAWSTCFAPLGCWQAGDCGSRLAATSTTTWSSMRSIMAQPPATDRSLTTLSRRSSLV